MNEDWKEVGDRAFNLYFRIYEKEVDHDAAQEAAVGEITGAMDEHGIEFEWAWTVDLPPTAVEAIIRRIGERMRDCEKAVGHPISGDFLWPMHTWISDALFQAKEEHSENMFSSLDEFINETLIATLPGD